MLAPSIRTGRRALPWAIALGGLLLRVVVALRPIEVVDEMFVPDDTYYTLSVARSLAHGGGPSVDGVHLTNGFQPLLAFVLAPVYALTNDPEVPLRVDWLLLSACDAVTALVLGALARRVARRNASLAALVATACWSLSPLAISYALGGLETSLALMMGALLVLAWTRARERGGHGTAAVAGVCAGLGVLARIDLVVLAGALGAWELFRGSRRSALVAASSAAIVVSPWWGYELARFHTVIPESGAAVREQAAVHQQLYMTLPKQIAWALGTVLEQPTGGLVDLRSLLGGAHETWAVWVPVLLVLATSTMMAAAKLVRPGPAQAPLRLLLGAAAWTWCFYAFYVPALWFFPRYLAPVHVALVLLIALAVAGLQTSAPSRRRDVARCIVVVALAPVVLSLGYVVRWPAKGTLDTGLHGAKGYARPAQEVLAMLPRGAVLGAFQSGALGYYAAGRGISVVNVDGVVDAAAARAFHDGQLGALFRERGVGNFADWSFNTSVLLRRWGGSGPVLTPVGLASPQGPDCFALTKITIAP